MSVTAPKEKRDKENTEKKRLSDWRGEGRHRLTPRMKMTVDERPPVCHLLHLLLAAYLFSFRVLLAFLRQLSHTKLWRGKGTHFISLLQIHHTCICYLPFLSGLQLHFFALLNKLSAMNVVWYCWGHDGKRATQPR